MNEQSSNKPGYLAKKQRYDNMITLFGRKPVLEVLRSSKTDIHRLHLATTNKSTPVMDEIQELATSRRIEIHLHSRQELSRISKNARQDQGVAVDMVAPKYQSLRDLAAQDIRPGFELLLLDRITNPQNLGMIIRCVAASPIAGLILPKAGCARLDPLVFKASAGTLFKATIYHCASTGSAIRELKRRGLTVCGLDAAADITLANLRDNLPRALVIGNETDGLSPDVRTACDQLVNIPLANQVDSLNVAAVAALVAFRKVV